MKKRSPPGDRDRTSEDFASALAAFEAEEAGTPRRDPRPGETVEGTIVAIDEEFAFVGLWGKAEGTVPLEELRDEDGRLPAVGDTVSALVAGAKPEGGWRLSVRPGRSEVSSDELRDAQRNGVAVEGVVTGVNKGGLEVTVAGVRAFCPISQVEARYVEDAQAYVGRRLQFRITRFEEPARGGRPNVVLSRRVLLEAEAARRAAETRARLEPGVETEGTVTSVTSYGAFVDLGGIEGLLHVSEMGYGRVEDPNEVVAVGQQVRVQVKSIEPGKEGKDERISLSMRALKPDPWQGVEARFPVGGAVSGRVTRLESFGAFVELAPGVEGLVHISELGGESRLAHARDAVAVGQEVLVEVTAVDLGRRRLSLSMRAVAAAAAAAEQTEALAELHRRQRDGGGGFGALADFFDKSSKKH